MSSGFQGAAAGLLLAAALAGCLGVQAPQALGDPAPTLGVVHGLDGLSPSARLVPMLPRAIGAQYPTGASALEPTLGSTSDGTLFMTSSRVNAVGPTRQVEPGIVRSMDRGLTWEDVSPSLAGTRVPPVTFDPYVIVDAASDRVFTADLSIACSWLSWSDDLGASWASNPAPCIGPGDDHQTLVTAKPRQVQTQGYPSVLYYCVNKVAGSFCRTSLDGGATFGAPSRTFTGVEVGQGFCGGLHGHVKASPEGRVLVPSARCGPPVVALSDDDGATWSQHTISDVSTRSTVAFGLEFHEHEVAVAFDEAGHAYALWIAADGLPRFAASGDGGMAWGPARVVSPPEVTAAWLPAIAAGADGRVAVSYIGTTIEGGYEARPDACSAVDCTPHPSWAHATWNGYLGVVLDAMDPSPTAITVTVNDPADPLARGKCGQTRCGGMVDFHGVVVTPEGRPYASFVDVCVAECVGDATSGNDGNEGIVGTLREGPSLRGPMGPLGALPAPPAPAARPAPEDGRLALLEPRASRLTWRAA